MAIRDRLTERALEEQPLEDSDGYRETETQVHATEKPGQPLWKMTDLIQNPDRIFEGPKPLTEEQPTLQMKIREEIKAISRDPTPEGIFSVKIGGRDIDFRKFEEYILNVSSNESKIVTRYHTAFQIAKMKGYLKGERIRGKVGGQR